VIPYEEVVAEFGKIVREVGPTFVYVRPAETLLFGPGNCLYVHTNPGPITDLTPGCIIGLWLHRFRGLALSFLQKFEGTGITPLLNEPPDKVFRELSEQLDGRTQEFLKQVQEHQDSLIPWSASVQRAKALADTLVVS
jgi:hypothetical protein